MKSSMAFHWPHFRLRSFELLGLIFAYWREAEVEGAIPTRFAGPDPVTCQFVRREPQFFALYRISVLYS